MAGSTFRGGQIALLCLGLVLSLASWLAYQPWQLSDRFMAGAPFGRDFINFWLAPRLVLAGRGDLLGDVAAYNGAIAETFRITVNMKWLFSYPPTILAPFVPFALLPYWPALLAFTALNLAALAWTLRLCARETATPRSGLVLLLLLSPPVAAMVTFGHFGGLLALAATVALRERERRPWLAGLCLAAIALKPHLALMLGLVLLGAGHWRWLPAAMLGTLALNGLSVLAFGLDPWRVFFAVTLPMQTAFLTDFHPEPIATLTSVFFSARFWGVSADAAWLLQGAVSLLGLALAAAVLRRDRLDPAGLCVVLLGAIVAMPYGQHYDVVIAAPALTLLVMDRAVAPRASVPVVLAWLLVPFARILTALDAPLLPLVLLGALAATAWPILRAPRVTRSEPLPAGALTC